MVETVIIFMSFKYDAAREIDGSCKRDASIGTCTYRRQYEYELIRENVCDLFMVYM